MRIRIDRREASDQTERTKGMELTSGQKPVQDIADIRDDFTQDELRGMDDRIIPNTYMDYTNQEEKYENVQYRNIFLMLASWGISSNIAGNAVSLAINTSSVSFRHGEHIISITYSDHFFTVIKDK